MIRKAWHTDKWLLTPQVEHARLSAIIASSWQFPSGKPHEQVFQAIMKHDSGWEEIDQKPLLKKNGDPLDFSEIAILQATPIYTSSIEHARASGQLYTTLLIMGHFLHLVENADMARASTRDAIEAGRFIARTRHEIKALQDEIRQHNDLTKCLDSYQTDLRFLQICDYLSLLLLSDLPADIQLPNVPYLGKKDKIMIRRKGTNLTLTLDPLPFKKNLRDHATSWVVPYIPYDSPNELVSALEEVKTTTNEVHLGSGN